MKFRDFDIDLQFTVESISHTPVYNFTEMGVFGWDAVYEYKQIHLVLIAKVGSSHWQIPYLLLLKKSLKREFLETYRVEMNANPEYFEYRKERYLNTPLFSLEEKEGLPILIDLLLLLDVNNTLSITNEEYNLINSNAILTEKDKGNIQGVESIKYCVKKFYSVASTTNGFLRNKAMWEVPHVNMLSIKSDGEKFMKIVFENTNQLLPCDSYNVVPVEYASSFSPSFKDLLEYKYASPIKSRILFRGNYEQCKIWLTDNDKFKELAKKAHKEEQDAFARKQQEEHDDYYNKGGWESDYFDAMTDGQLGDYNDYSGDIDDIETWSRG